MSDPLEEIIIASCDFENRAGFFLKGEWDSCCRALGISNNDKVFDELINEYSNPTRCYHGLIHLWWVIKESKKYSAYMEHPEEVTMALFFHDAVYNPKSTDGENVILSSKQCMDFLMESGVNISVKSNIFGIIRGTTHNEKSNTSDEAIARDIDLSMIIGFMPEAIETLVRKEYNFVPEIIYRLERKRILKTFYLKERIFESEPFQGQEPKMHAWLLKMIQYNGARVVVGGTFDLFHKGHRALIKKAFECAGKNPYSEVVVGLTSDKMALKKSHPVQPFSARARAIRNFIAREKYQPKYTIQSLDSPEGDLLTELDYDFLVASKETRGNAEHISRLRNDTLQYPIILTLIEVITDGKGRISSTRLRCEDKIK